jgi:hypothetical protein
VREWKLDEAAKHGPGAGHLCRITKGRVLLGLVIDGILREEMNRGGFQIRTSHDSM